MLSSSQSPALHVRNCRQRYSLCNCRQRYREDKSAIKRVGVDISEKKARTKWSADEETGLLSAVLEREDVLFGDFKGLEGNSGIGWEKVAYVLNALEYSKTRSLILFQKHRPIIVAS